MDQEEQARQSSNNNSNNSDDITVKYIAVWVYVQVLCNLGFIIWVYVALSRRLKLLRSEGQHFKLKLFEKLARALCVFVGVVVLLYAVLTAGRWGMFHLPWHLTWLAYRFSLLFSLLELLVTVSLALICRPTSSSSLLSLYAQMPVDETTADAFDDAEIEMSSRFEIGGYDDDSEDGDRSDSGNSSSGSAVDEEEVEVDLMVVPTTTTSTELSEHVEERQV